ncbi:MAG: hypothetical protein R6V31_08340 [Halohasta sp.]
MQTTPRTLGRREALRGCVGLAATAAVAAGSGAAQSTDNGTETPDESANESTMNGTATNETDGNASAEGDDPAANESAKNETGDDTANETTGDEPANETGAAGSDGDTAGSAGGLSPGEITAVFGGILAAALLSPLLFALLLRAVYTDDKPANESTEHRP